MTLDDLTVNFSHLNRDNLLSDWKWLIGETRFPILITASGDAFIEDINDRTVHFLDAGAGNLEIVAKSSKEFRDLLSDKEFVVKYLAVQMIGDLIQADEQLEEGKIYSFIKPPVLGGEYVLENIEKIDIELHFSTIGQIHEQVMDLPPGTPINEIKFKG